MNLTFTKKIFLYLIFLILLLFFSYRDFLITYRMMLLDEYFLYYHYQDIIIYYETGDLKFADNLPMRARFLGLWLQFLVYKLIPCISLTNLQINPNYSEFFECTTFSLALINFIFKYSIIVLFLYYMRYILRRPIAETLFSIIFCFILIGYIESFTFDRLIVFYTLLILVFLNHKYFSIILILLSIFVSEKVIMVIGPLLFIKIIFLNEKTKLPQFIASIISVFLYFCLILYLKKFQNFEISNLYDGASFERLALDFTNKSHISNSILPIIFCLIPYLIFFIDKKKNNLNFSGYEFCLPILMIFLGVGGGEHNLGRYAMHTFIIWLPLLASQMNFYFNNLIVINEK